MDKKIIIGIIAIVLIIGIIGFKKEALLPPGQYRASAGCSFITNTMEGSDYKEEGGWVSIDVGSGMEGYGYMASSVKECEASRALNIYSPEGYEVCLFQESSELIMVALPDVFAAVYDKTESEAADAILECTACTDTTWTPDPATICLDTPFTQTSNCGNTRSAIGTMDCGGGPCSGPGDLNNDCEVELSEVITIAQIWVSGGTY